MLFDYIVVGSDAKEQRGKIEASNENEARAKLNEMGLSVLSINVSAISHKKNDGINSYIFSGVDPENKTVDGSIEATDELQAYKRLVEEFELDVKWLVDDSLKDAVKESLKKKSIEIIEDLALERGINIGKKVAKKSDTVQLVYDENFQKKQKLLIEKIAKLQDIVSVFMQDIKESNPNKASEYEASLDNLQKIKMSNNLISIEDSIDSMLESIVAYFHVHKDLSNKYKNEILELETMFSNAAQAKMQKMLRQFAAGFYGVWDFVVEFFEKTFEKKAKIKSSEKIMLVKLKSERKNYLFLLLFHMWKFISTKALREKHKEAFFKIWTKYKQSTKMIRKIEDDVKKLEDFYEKEKRVQHDTLKIIVDEISYFSAWLFAIYLALFAIVEIAILKSKILPADFAWKILHSDLLVGFCFFFFIVLLFSGFVKNEKSYIKVSLNYLLVVIISLLYFYNY